MDDVEDVEAGEDAAAGIAAQLVIKNNRDYFEELSDKQFLRNFRFDKDSVLRIVHLLEGHLKTEGEGNQRLDPEHQVPILFCS